MNATPFIRGLQLVSDCLRAPLVLLTLLPGGADTHDSIEMPRSGLLVLAESGSRQRNSIAIAISDAAWQWQGRLAIVQ